MSYLPTLNACLNATSALFLIGGFYFIRQRNRKAHQICMGAAFLISVLFLISYLTYHYYAGSIRFTGQGVVRVVYFSILLSHTIFAAVVPILAVITLWRAVHGRYEQHRRIARWTLPIWLYVSVTGVVVYLMLYHLYPSGEKTSSHHSDFRLAVTVASKNEPPAKIVVMMRDGSIEGNGPIAVGFPR